MALTIHPNGDYDIHHLRSEIIILNQMREIRPNTYFELIRCGPHADMWIDEEGLRKGLPTNDHASRIAERIALRSGRIVGAVLFTGPPNADGETTGLSVGVMSDLVDLIH